MKIIIFYHEIQRELQNAYLLKAELVRRGHEVYIYHYDYIKQTKQVLAFVPDIIITHSFHDPRSANYMTELFSNKITRVVNLQYEQVLSEVWADYHIPKELEKNAIHLCWGEHMKNKLVSNGIGKKNAVVVGSLSVDMDRIKFRSIYKSREEISHEYNLQNNKQWILFISSFSMSELKHKRKKVFFSLLGEKNTLQFCEVSTKSKNIILKWIEEYIKNNDCEFIYRPHPYEKRRYNNFNILDILEKKYDNFHLISDDSVRTWINVCDKINTWISTSVSDAYFMNKNCSILRPIDIPPYLDLEIMQSFNIISNYEDFYNYNKLNDTACLLSNENIMKKYYFLDENKYAYEKICDLLEKIVKKNIVMNLYK